ncbi:hypothetical protein [uncultured Bacteroides sp.]|uniref:hypothetical protein n=1 Tax=uncultured Bacteroides sp. TaxID=162156 RepID=UPI002AA6B57D|nr:hypothetical protein [uncultured Bacteroides sp.]
MNIEFTDYNREQNSAPYYCLAKIEYINSSNITNLYKSAFTVTQSFALPSKGKHRSLSNNYYPFHYFCVSIENKDEL